MHVARSLLQEVHRAELWEQGVFIDLGTPDQHKYTRGGWKTGWGAARSSPVTHTEVRRSATLHLHDWRGGIRSLVLRLRSASGAERLLARFDDHELAARDVSDGWSTVELPLPAPSVAGRHTVQLEFPRRERLAGAAAALIDWVWLRTEPAPPPRPEKVAVRVFGDPRRSLLAESARAYSYYLEVPPAARLVFGFAALGRAEFTVDTQSDGRPPRRWFHERASARWQERQLDLSSLAGQMIRLDLGVTGKNPHAAWAEPAIIVPGPAPVARRVRSVRARNTLQIVVDAARQDIYRPFNPKTRLRAPAVERLAREGVRFNEAYANANWTVPSVATLLSGTNFARYAWQLNGGKGHIIPSSVPLLSEHLKRHGVESALFSENCTVATYFGFNRGWSHFEARDSGILESPEIFSNLLLWLEQNRGKRFYIYVHLKGPHMPFFFREQTARYLDEPYVGRLGHRFRVIWGRRCERYSAADLRYLKALYFGEADHTDSRVARLLRRLQDLGLLEETLIVFSNDHGDQLCERGELGHPPYSQHDEVTRSPLIMRHRALFPAGLAVDRIVELMDVAPTILSAMGVPPHPAIHGEDLIAAMDGTPALVPGYAISEGMVRSLRVGSYRYVLGEPAGNASSLDHDLPSEQLTAIRRALGESQELLFGLHRDPREQIDLSRSHPIARRACEVYLGEGTATPAKRHRLTSMVQDAPRLLQTVLDAATRRRLEALGYL
jgi:hypothetical protein